MSGVPHRSLAGLVSAYKSYGNWEDNRTLEQHPACHLRLRWEEFAIDVGCAALALLSLMAILLVFFVPQTEGPNGA